MDEVIVYSEPLQGINLIVANTIYDKAHTCLQEILTHPSIDDTILILKTLTTVSSLLEATQINDKKIKGSDKKKIAVYVCKKLVTDCVSVLHQSRIKDLSERVADDFIEIFIDFAKKNKLIKKIHFPCSC